MRNSPRALSDPFYYIPKIIDKDDFNYHVHGGGHGAIIYPVLGGSTNNRISKGLKIDSSGNRLAILDTSVLKFDINIYPIDDDVGIQ